MYSRSSSMLNNKISTNVRKVKVEYTDFYNLKSRNELNSSSPIRDNGWNDF